MLWEEGEGLPVSFGIPLLSANQCHVCQVMTLVALSIFVRRLMQGLRKALKVQFGKRKNSNKDGGDGCVNSIVH